jgi:hypothetical protein
MVDMYIATIPNRNSPPAILLRESYREDGKVKNRTLANLSKLPPQSIEVLRRSLKGENLVSSDSFDIIEDGSPAHDSHAAVGFFKAHLFKAFTSPGFGCGHGCCAHPRAKIKAGNDTLVG